MMQFNAESRPVPLAPGAILDRARLYPDRFAALGHWPKGAAVAEVGVWRGDFTDRILEITTPSKFCGIDFFGAHMMPAHAAAFDGLPQQDFYCRRFATQIASGMMTVHQGMSQQVLAGMQPNTFDVIYIDAGHAYQAVAADAAASISLLRPNGLLVFNDYTAADLAGQAYGIITVVNQMLNTRQWLLEYFAFERNGFHDVALRRAG